MWPPTLTTERSGDDVLVYRCQGKVKTTTSVVQPRPMFLDGTSSVSDFRCPLRTRSNSVLKKERLPRERNGKRAWVLLEILTKRYAESKKNRNRYDSP